MAILLCQLPLFSKTLLPAERPLRHSGDTSYYAHRLLAGSRHQEWIGRGWASPLYKHRLLVNLGALNRNMSWPPLFLSSFSPIQLLPPTQESSYCGRRRLHKLSEASESGSTNKRHPQSLSNIYVNYVLTVG